MLNVSCTISLFTWETLTFSFVDFLSRSELFLFFIIFFPCFASPPSADSHTQFALFWRFFSSLTAPHNANGETCLHSPNIHIRKFSSFPFHNHFCFNVTIFHLIRINIEACLGFEVSSGSLARINRETAMSASINLDESRNRVVETLLSSIWNFFFHFSLHLNYSKPGIFLKGKGFTAICRKVGENCFIVLAVSSLRWIFKTFPRSALHNNFFLASLFPFFLDEFFFSLSWKFSSSLGYT